MNQPASDNKLDPQDPHRKEIQPPIPTHPPDPAAAGDADKVVGPATPERDPDSPPLQNTGIGSGPSIDEEVGGAGLGKVPGDGDAAARDRDTRAEDLLDRTRNT
jgi:hypothetical protein